MAFVVSDLPEYVNQNRDTLLTAAVLGGETLDTIDVMLGVKHKEAVGVLVTTAPFQDASTCGWNAQGTDTISDRALEVKTLKVNKQYCLKDLKPKFLNRDLQIAAGRETLPFEETFMNENSKQINHNLETIIWQGDASLGFDGFIDILGDEEDVIDSSVAAGSTFGDLIDDVYAHIPAAVLAQDPVIFVSHTGFRAWIAELNATCCANRPIIDAASGEIKYPGDSRVTVKPVTGLEGTKIAVGGAAKNFVYGTDIEGSENIYDLWYEKKDDMYLYRVEFNAGVQVKLPSEIVMSEIAAA